MAASTAAKLRRRERLTTGADYRRVFRSGIRVDGPLFLMVAAQNDRGYCRLGLAAGRRVGGAVDRNRAKRLLRESFRRNKSQASSFDLILVPKREISGPGQEEVDREYRDRLRRLSIRSSGKRRAAAPAPR